MQAFADARYPVSRHAGVWRMNPRGGSTQAGAGAPADRLVREELTPAVVIASPRPGGWRACRFIARDGQRRSRVVAGLTYQT